MLDDTLYFTYFDIHQLVCVNAQIFIYILWCNNRKIKLINICSRICYCEVTGVIILTDFNKIEVFTFFKLIFERIGRA